MYSMQIYKNMLGIEQIWMLNELTIRIKDSLGLSVDLNKSKSLMYAKLAKLGRIITYGLCAILLLYLFTICTIVLYYRNDSSKEDTLYNLLDFDVKF